MSNSENEFGFVGESEGNMWAIRSNLVVGGTILRGAAAVVSGGRIARILSAEETSLPGRLGCPVIEEPSGYLVPGFIDIHVHGGYGADFMDATAESLDAITAFHGRNGTTGMLATTVTASKEDIDRVLRTVNEYLLRGAPYADLYGVHLEGPFISEKWPGAQNPKYIVPPQMSWVEEWTRRYPELVKMITLAPETEGAIEMIGRLSKEGIVCACGHTDATYDQLLVAADHGLTHAVHTFNAMTGLHHRSPGTVGAVLTEDRICAEVIADGHHVHPACIQLLTRAKRSGNLILITDAIAAAGMGDGQYELGGLDVSVQGGVARLTDGGSLAGSTLTMIDAFRFMVQRIGLSLPEASALASANPARRLGLEAKTGSIEEGKSADLVLLADDLSIRGVWSCGRRIAGT